MCLSMRRPNEASFYFDPPHHIVSREEGRQRCPMWAESRAIVRARVSAEQVGQGRDPCNWLCDVAR